MKRTRDPERDATTTVPVNPITLLEALLPEMVAEVLTRLPRASWAALARLNRWWRARIERYVTPVLHQGIALTPLPTLPDSARKGSHGLRQVERYDWGWTGQYSRGGFALVNTDRAFFVMGPRVPVTVECTCHVMGFSHHEEGSIAGATETLKTVVTSNPVCLCAFRHIILDAWYPFAIAQYYVSYNDRVTACPATPPHDFQSTHDEISRVIALWYRWWHARPPLPLPPLNPVGAHEPADAPQPRRLL